MTPEQRQAARARCEEASGKTWRPLLSSIGMTGVHAEDHQIYHASFDPVCIKETHEMQKRNADFIANCRTDLPLALDHIDYADGVIDRQKRRIGQIEFELQSLKMRLAAECGREIQRGRLGR